MKTNISLLIAAVCAKEYTEPVDTVSFIEGTETPQDQAPARQYFERLESTG